MARAKGNSNGSGVIINKGKDKGGKGIWEVQLTIASTSGNRKRVTRTVHGTKKDAQTKLRELKNNSDKGIDSNGSKMKFADFANQWHQARVDARSITPVTIEREANTVKLLNDYIGGVEIGKITPALVEKTYQRIRQDKINARGKFSETSMNMIHGKLKQIMRKAVDYDLVLRNPCDRVTAPSREKVTRRSLSKSEGVDFLDKLNKSEDEAYASMEQKNVRVQADHKGKNKPTKYLYGMGNISSVIAVRIGLATGMRRGEVLALTWEHVSLMYRDGKPVGRIHVMQSMDAFGSLKGTKTDAGTRSLYLDSKTAESLMRWQSEQARLFAYLGIRQTLKTPVVCSSKGGFMDSRNFYHWWQDWTKDKGFEGLKFHELRHTQASQLLGNGIDLATVQYRLGHASASITLDFYSHALPENDQKAAEVMGGLFEKTTEVEQPACVVDFPVKTA